jgi:hypothetical protein
MPLMVDLDNGLALTSFAAVTGSAAPTLSGAVVVAAVSAATSSIAAESTTRLSHDDYKHMNFTAMRTNHWDNAAGYDCEYDLLA